MGWTSAEGVAAVVQGAVCVSSFLVIIFMFVDLSGEASGSVCGIGGVKRKRADSGHLMEVDHNQHPRPQRPSKK